MNIVAIGFVDHDSVGHFHNASFDSLQFVASAGKLDKQEKVDHGMDRSLALPYPDCFYEYVVVAGGFTQHYGFTGLARHTSE